MTTKSGFVSIIGRPNVGKSTLLNALIGQKISIVSDKPQTTRNRINGIYSCEQGQAIFIDTPGLHKPKHKLGEYMVRTAERALNEVDLVLFVVDVAGAFNGGDTHIIELLKESTTPVVLVANKIDLLKDENLEQHLQPYVSALRFAGVQPISASLGTNIDALIELIFSYLPPGPYYYPPEDITDVPERFVVSEIIREKVLMHTREEVPHSVAVEIEEFKEKPDGMTYIRASIYTERESQKGILIGAGGSMLKRIGQEARQQIEYLLDNSVYLDLWIKVRKDWRDSEQQLRRLGYHEDNR
ncbi:MAG: GTPase Era [Methylocystaceae bacterium]